MSRTATPHHFFVDPSDIDEGAVTLRGDEAHHAARVLRIRPGEAITVADGTGRIVDAVVVALGDVVRAEVRGERRGPLARPAITLFQAVAKGDKLETVVEKATEVGVRRIVPFVAERTIARWDERKRARVHDRLCAIALGAAKQSGAAIVPDVWEVHDDAAEVTEFAPVLVLHREAKTRLRDALPEPTPHELCLVVGPEGGLAQHEVDALEATGARAVTLGDRILRTETAGPVAAAVVGYAYGWFG